MIYLDTHVVIWLYEGLVDRLSKKAIQMIEENDLIISAMVSLEIQLLYDTKKISQSPHVILNGLEKDINLTVCDLPLNDIIQKANNLLWTQ